MEDYEIEENGRVLCERHGLIRCGECQEIDDLEKENHRYKQALEYIASIEFYEGTQELYADMSEASETAENALRGDTNE